MKSNEVQDSHEVMNQVALALADGEVGLWLGPEWRSEGDHQALANQDWLGIWSESTDPAAASFLAHAWEDRPFGRTFVEVPGQIHEALDRDFKFARICPFFYLAGRHPDKTDLTQKRRAIVRASHVDQIERLGPVTLLIAGVGDPHHLLEVLKDDLENVTGRLRRVVVTGAGAPQAWRDVLRTLGEHINSKTDLCGESLLALLTRLTNLRDRKVRVGADLLLVGKHKKDVPLRKLLRTDPPVDQYFHLITAHDLRPADVEENRHDMIVSLLSGQTLPWRAFRHNLEWRRSALEVLKDQVLSVLNQMSSPAPPSVRCLNLEADAGAGLTTLLQFLAFHAADRGYPTLVARDSSQRFEFDVLRTFLVDLDHHAAEQHAEGVPAVIVVDAGASEHDPTHTFKELPRRLRASGRRALLIRGATSLKELPTPTFMESDISVPKLRSELDEDEYGSLKEWVRETYARLYPDKIGQILESTKQWMSGDEGMPPVSLLVALYYLLEEDLRQAGDFGRHLLKPLVRVVSELARDRQMRADKAGIAVKLNDGTVAVLNLGDSARGPRVGPQQILEALTITAATAQLNDSVPIAVLGKLIGTDSGDTYRVLNCLEKARLVKTDELADNDTRSRRLMPVSYYQDWETVSTVHPVYGPMILASLCTSPDELRRPFEGSSLCKEIVAAHEAAEKHPKDLPLELFKPLLHALEPGISSHRWFAEYVSMQYLRPQRYSDVSESVNPVLLERILEVFDWLHPALVESSGPILHSRAISRRARGFRLGNDHLGESRDYFQGAIADIDLAIELESERPGGEDLGNLKTTCGLIHRDWAVRELQSPDGMKGYWDNHCQLARTFLREACDVRLNSYPAHALANLLLHALEFNTGKRQVPTGKEDWTALLTPTEFARDLSEVMDLLSWEPELAFREVWEQTKSRAIGLLDDDQALKVIDELQRNGDDMGYALEALRILQSIPRHPTSNNEEVARMQRAALVLDKAEQLQVAPCALGNLLRYAVFSAQPERALDHRPYESAYRQRYMLMRRLLDQAGSSYLKDPLWRYDAAMLCFQNRQIGEGRRHFAELRKAYRYMQVPSERTVPWVRDPDKPIPIVASLRITRVDRTNDRGWGRLLDEKLGYTEEIPFRISNFTARRIYGPDVFQPGKRIDARIQLRPAGPYAIPAEE